MFSVFKTMLWYYNFLNIVNVTLSSTGMKDHNWLMGKFNNPLSDNLILSKVRNIFFINRNDIFNESFFFYFLFYQKMSRLITIDMFWRQFQRWCDIFQKLKPVLFLSIKPVVRINIKCLIEFSNVAPGFAKRVTFVLFKMTHFLKKTFSEIKKKNICDDIVLYDFVYNFVQA